jgi:multisubunit Na+/H+ antiporter MnhG subunit
VSALLITFISVVWLVAAVTGVALCRAAARGDADMRTERPPGRR